MDERPTETVPAPTLDYRRPPPRRARRGGPSGDWWVLLLSHAALSLIGGMAMMVALAGLLAGKLDGGVTLLCCGLPAVVGVPSLFVGVRGMFRLGSGKDPTR